MDLSQQQHPSRLHAGLAGLTQTIPALRQGLDPVLLLFLTLGTAVTKGLFNNYIYYYNQTAEGAHSRESSLQR